MIDPPDRGARRRDPQRIIALLLVSSLAFLLVAGCGGRERGEADGKIVLRFWQFWRTEWIRPLVDRFEAENPGIVVELEQLTWQAGQEKIQAALAAGNAPDLCELGSTWLPRFAADGVLVDVSAVADTLAGKYMQWEPARHAGKVYGLPWVVGTRALFYNRELFGRAGLDPVRGPETWDELITAATRITALGPEIHGFGLNAGERYVLFKKFMPFAWGNGGAVLTPDMGRSAFASRANVEALEFYVRLAKVSMLEKQDVIDRAFQEGSVGMMISGAWNLRTLADNAPELDYDVALVPRPAAGRGSHASFAGGEFLVSFTGSRHPDQAIALARFLIRPDNAVALCRAARSVQPAARGAAEDPYYLEHPRDRLFVEQLATAVAPPPHPRWGEIEQALDLEIEEALYGRKTPAVAVSDAAAGIDRLLAEDRGQ